MRFQAHAAITLLLPLALSCGGDGGGRATATPALPRAGDPAFGAAGHVLVSDRGVSRDDEIDLIWIGFDRTAEWEALLKLREDLAGENTGPQIGGRVVSDRRHPLGFYFDPATTTAAEFTAETLQTSIDALKADPERAAQAQHLWFIPGFVERIVPGQRPE
jgi:hypothetical protein